MNIFFTDPCPIKCAENLDTKRVNKMILESCQMLCTAINLSGGISPYKSTHKNHPSSVWARKTLANWNWLWDHMVALTKEYEKRRGKTHLSYTKMMEADLPKIADKLLPNLPLTEKPNCAARKSMGISYKHVEDVYTAYQLYLDDRWNTDKFEPTWS